ncbi:magnesium and cobalt transport protein CorA [Kitasatospora camelliae]|uniref:Magnesium and cobalt transport protein CorA n=1 Tax=Kitasatospora camelliae TaxID=3156397 RepID=A0AAU8K6E2_9ACTN
MGSQPAVDCARYERGERLPGTVDLAGPAVPEAGRPDRFVWVGLDRATPDGLAEAAAACGADPRAVDHALRVHLRPGLERFGETVVLVLKTVSYVPHKRVTATGEIVETGQVTVFTGPGFALVAQQGGAGCPPAAVRRELEAAPDRLALGPAAVLHAVAHAVVAGHLAVADAFDRDVEELESAVFSPERTDDAQRFYQLKRELLEFRRAVLPLGSPLRRLTDGTLPDLPAELAPYLREVLHRHALAVERLAAFDELVTGILAASVSRLTVQQNADMRRMSVGAAALAVPTIVFCLYGMNFDVMPELRLAFGYPAALLLSVGIGALVVRAFRRNDWL